MAPRATARDLLTSLGVQRIGRRVVQHVLDEGQRVLVEARLRGRLAGGRGARLHLEVALVVRREDALDVDYGALRVALLDGRGERAADGVGRDVVVVIADLAAPRLGAADVQAMRAAARCVERNHIVSVTRQR